MAVTWLNMHVQMKQSMEDAAQAQYQHHQSMAAAYGQGGVPSAMPFEAGQEPPRAPAGQKLAPEPSHHNTNGALPAAGLSLRSKLCCMQQGTALCKHEHLEEPVTARILPSMPLMLSLRAWWMRWLWNSSAY